MRARWRAWKRRWGTDVLLVLVVLVGFAPIVADNSAQPASRYSLTAAFAEHGSVDLSRYEGALSIDRVEYQGELRSDKAPGQPLLGVPFHLVARAVGAESATHLRIEGNLGLWWQTLWLATVPFAVLLVVMRRTAARFAPRHALVATTAIGFATPLLPHAVNLYGQVLAALLGFGSWLLAGREAADRRSLLWAGLLGGAAVTVEYHAAIVLLVVAGYCAVRLRRQAWWYAAGCLAPLGLLGLYHQVAFGAPWREAHSYWTGPVPADFRLPGLRGFGEVFAGRHGLLISSPVVLLALVGAALGAAAASRWRTHATVALVIGGCYLLLSVSWSGSLASEDPGPRYLLPSLPFLAVPLAGVWSRWRVLSWGTTAVSAATAVLASITSILSPSPTAPLRAGYERVIHGELVPTLWSLALGPWGVVVHVATVVGLAWIAMPSIRREVAALRDRAAIR